MTFQCISRHLTGMKTNWIDPPTQPLCKWAPVQALHHVHRLSKKNVNSVRADLCLVPLWGKPHYNSHDDSRESKVEKLDLILI